MYFCAGQPATANDGGMLCCRKGLVPAENVLIYVFCLEQP